MPITKSAKKRMKTSETQRVANKSIRSRIATARRKLHDAIAAGDNTQADQKFRSYCSIMDKAAKKDVIKANTASRKKSRAAKKLAAMRTPPLAESKT